MKVRNTRSHQEGFTLIELLVVVAIIALLVTVAVPKLFDAINKAKAGTGLASLDTISSALERNYFDQNAYPNGMYGTPPVATSVDTQLKNLAYVKPQTTFLNGFNKGFLYVTNGTGSYYVLGDPGNATGTVKIQCGTIQGGANAPGLWTSNSMTVGGAFTSDTTVDPGPTQGQVSAGCAVYSFDPSKTPALATTPVTNSKVVSN